MTHSSSDQKATNSSRRSFLKIGAGVLAGAAVAASAVPISFAGAATTTTPEDVASLHSELNSYRSQNSALQAQLSSAQSEVGAVKSEARSLQAQSTDLQTELDTLTGFLTLSVSEQSILGAATSAIIPTDSNGPGATEAGVVYFIDRQLAMDYGKSGNMFMQGPFVLTGQSGPITIDGITYPKGTVAQRVNAGTRYQYKMPLRDFFRYGLQALQTYSNSAYGGNFETLSQSQQLQALTDLWNNKPTSFNGIVPQDFAYELVFMTWSGFLMDPLHGGNRNMVGWQYVAFNGVNTGNFYGEGYNSKQLMVASTPTRLKPASLAQFEKGAP